MSDNEKMSILARIENGELDPQQGAELLANLGKENTPDGQDKHETMQVLEMVESGELSPDEAVNRFKEEANISGGPRMRYIRDEDAASYFTDNPRVKGWQNWWTVPLWVGVGVTILSSFWTYSILQSEGTNFWFYCSFVPLFMGVAGIALAWASRNSRWLHVRVRETANAQASKVAVSFPLPISPVAWVLRNFGNHIPYMRETIVDEVLEALDNEKNEGKPFYIEVEDDEDGEHVEVFIG